MTPKTFLTSCLLLLVCLLSGCGKSGDYHRRIHYSERMLYWWRLAYPGHGRSVVTLCTLKVDGVKYQYVSGPEPAYIDVPGQAAIVFVTEAYDPKTEKFSGRALNYYDFKAKRHILFEPRGALFGLDSIVPRDGLAPFVLVESFDGGILVLIEKNTFGWVRMFFDLKSGRYTHMQYMTFDKNSISTDPSKPSFVETNEYTY